MPIDINQLRVDKGGNPDHWRAMVQKRFKPVELVDLTIELDEVCSRHRHHHAGGALRGKASPHQFVVRTRI